MPSILFVHENYPAQFGTFAGYLKAQGWRVVFATARGDFPQPPEFHTTSDGVFVVRYGRHRDPKPETHAYLRPAEMAVLNGQGFARMAARLAKGGFVPDIVMAHSGWGSGSFAKVVWPDTRFVQYLEWWYNFPAPDSAPGTGDTPPEEAHARTLCRNIPFFMDFQHADAVIAPTAFQADQAPPWLRPQIEVIHEGVDCRAYRPAAPGEPGFSHEGLPDDAPIITFATRGMEPIRGFPAFMAAASALQGRRPDLHVVVAGSDRSHYGPPPPGATSWREKMLQELPFDRARLHFTGRLPLDRYRRLLRRTAAHAYLTRPFVLSWSLVEAMASGSPLVVSDVAPVREALPDPGSALFVPGTDPARIAAAVASCLDDPAAANARAERARAWALDAYDQADLLPRKARMLERIMAAPG